MKENRPLKDIERKRLLLDAEEAYAKFMDVVLPGWKEDPNSSETPKRVAKMFVNELFTGLNNEPPKITVFENSGEYGGIVFQGNIEIRSMCSHHHMPFFGKAHVAYIPKKKGMIVGLSKLNRIVEFYARRPQVQETLTIQIHDAITNLVGLMNNDGVAVMIEAQHTCVSHRGIGQDSTMKTAKLSGSFLDKQDTAKEEFYNFIRDLKG